MKTLQIVRQFYPSTGGMEDYVANLCRQLRLRGHVADVATLDYLFKSDEPLKAYELHDGTDIIRLPSRGNARYFFAPRLLELLPRYDIVHVHGVDFFIDLLGVLRRVHTRPVVLSTHGGFFHTSWFPQFKRLYFNTLTRASLRGVDAVIASSPGDAELFERISNRVSRVDNGIDYPFFAAVEKQVVPGRMLFIGRISRNKRVDRLIETLARVRRDHPEAHLVVVGPDWEGLQPRYAGLARSLELDGAVTFTGALPRDDLLAELAAAELFVSASEYEAFGISTVEAMAAATVPLVNNIRAFADIIDDGRNGFLADFGDADSAAAVMDSVLRLPRERLAGIGSAAREAARRYDWPAVADAIVAIYTKVLGR